MNLPTNATAKSLTGVRICLVEDDRASAKIYARWIEAAGASVQRISNVEEFKRALEGVDDGQNSQLGWVSSPSTAPEIVIADLVLPDGSGLDIVSMWRKHFPQSPYLMLTAFATVENAVESMKLGAFDFLRKPIHQEELLYVIAKAHEHACLIRENQSLASAVRILGMAQTLAGIGEKTQLLKTLGRLLHRETKAQECFVFLYHAQRKQTESLLDLRVPGIARTMPEDIVQRLLLPHVGNRPPPPENFADVDLSVLLMPQVFERPAEGAMLIELSSPTGNLGYVVLVQKEGAFTLGQRKEELYPILVQAARALQTLDVSATLSFVDELTGLYNQRFLDVTLTSEVARANRYGAPVSILFIDLDKFKSVNDNHGHVVGSQIIKEAARILKLKIRDSDQLIRYGGDEFIAILPNTNLTGSVILAERIRASFEETFFDVRDITGVASAHNLNVTTSIGVACYPQCAISAQELIQQADDSMYASKRAGKNAVTSAPEK